MSSNDVSSQLSQLVLAWANDALTGRAVYIGELTRGQTGKRCSCICPSCKAALEAVNAGRLDGDKRPHFRHGRGYQRDNCAIAIAREAALAMLRQLDVVELPPRMYRSSSGSVHEVKGERVRLVQAVFDHAIGELTLEDGRVLRVEIVGSTTEFTSEQTHTTAAGSRALMQLPIDDPLIAAMSPDQIRERLSVAFDLARWCSHWQDSALEAAVRADEISELQRKIHWETVLHAQIKKILLASKSLFVPSRAPREDDWDGKRWRNAYPAPPGRLRFASIVSESPIDEIIPDLTAHLDGVPPNRPEMERLFIEVVVTHAPDERKIETFKRIGSPALAIYATELFAIANHVSDSISNEMIRDSLLNHHEGKAWLYHPYEDVNRFPILQNLTLQKSVESHQIDSPREAKPRPQIVSKYGKQNETLSRMTQVPAILIEQALAAAELHFQEDGRTDSEGFVIPSEQFVQTKEKLVAACREISKHGYAAILEPEFLNHRGLLACLISFRHNRPIGFRSDIVGILKDVRASQNLQLFGLYLSAWTQYRLSEKYPNDTAAWITEWKNNVRQRIKERDPAFLPDVTYHPIVKVIFPELASAMDRLSNLAN